MKVFSKKSKVKAPPKPKKFSKFEIVLDRKQLTVIKECLKTCLEHGTIMDYQVQVAAELLKSFRKALNAKL